jgi:hypothetical protein
MLDSSLVPGAFWYQILPALERLPRGALSRDGELDVIEDWDTASLGRALGIVLAVAVRRQGGWRERQRTRHSQR